jgi:anti-anti-sigma factor
MVINYEHSAFKITTLNKHTVAIRLEGKFGKHMNEILREKVMTTLKDFKQDVVIDLTRVEDIDTAGIALLVECIRVSEATNASFKVVGINNKIKDIFEMLKLSTLFDNIQLSQIPRTNDHVLFHPKSA